VSRVIDQRVANLDELQLEHGEKGDKFAWNSARVGPRVGAKQLGYSYDVIPPGKRGCPFHSHRAQEEMFFIVKGTGTLRYGAETRKVRAGDIICCPVGGPETAHQLVNDSTEDLCFLSVSTMTDPEVCEYPDSGKIIAFDGKWRHSTEGASGSVDYWKGEA
jgi:uncharacterized cupin superfamily protein